MVDFIWDQIVVLCGGFVISFSRRELIVVDGIDTANAISFVVFDSFDACDGVVAVVVVDRSIVHILLILSIFPCNVNLLFL